MFQIPSGKKYYEKLKSKAYTGLALRVLVAGYVLYLAWMIASGSISGESTMPVWCVILFCTLFAVSAVFFIIYAIRSFIKALKAAEIRETSDTEEQ
ncbi:MAG TPA: hypothetical protein PKI60_04930 [Oscillospiraceae bacterium]|nr:hypothetical protein [Oscillospiraceae bacterium]